MRVVLVFNKTCKRVQRFDTPEGSLISGSLYVSKDIMPEPQPTLEIDVDVDERS